MHRLLIAVLYLLLQSEDMVAQVDSLPPMASNNEWYLKLGLLSPFDVDGGIGISGEYFLYDSRLGFQLEVQPILFSVYRSDRGSSGIEVPAGTLQSAMPFGIKLRPEVRYYLNRRSSKKNYRPRVRLGSLIPYRRNSEFRSYVAIDFLFKYTATQRRGNLNISNGGFLPAYRQEGVYTDVKKVTGFDIKVGGITPVFDGERWFLETYFGFGFRYKKFHFKNLPVGASEPARSTGFNVFGVRDRTARPNATQGGISLPVGIKLSFRL